MMGTMTTEQPNVHVLRRRTEGRVIAGVASGLGDYLNVDPLLIRIAFVGLMVFGGLGLILYVGAWLLLPDATHGVSIAEQLLRRVHLTPARLVAGILIVIGGLLLLQALSTSYWQVSIGPVALASVIVVVGVVLLRQNDRHPWSGRAAGAQAASPLAASQPAHTSAVTPARRRVKRPPSPLGWYALAATFGAVGLFAMAANLLALDTNPGQFFGLALAAIGIGLVVGTWWGRARILVLLGSLLLPVAVAASFVTAPLEGGVGDHRFQPSSAAELRSVYRLMGGRLQLDLTRIETASEPITISASVAVGQVRVTLPANARLDVDSAVGAGDIAVLGSYQVGSGLTDRHVDPGSAGPQFILDLEAGIGEVVVDGGPAGGR